jgi:hypothetical protein
MEYDYIGWTELAHVMIRYRSHVNIVTNLGVPCPPDSLGFSSYSVKWILKGSDDGV